ncbi:MAG: hypothetical protein OYH77_03355, partial [Pseudomonadota bacterium]|nr:hypothetical protein [Pseudomonadota bacterium]
FSPIMDALTGIVKDKVLTIKTPGKPFIDQIAIGHKASDVSNPVVKITGINNNKPLPATLFRVSDYKVTLNTDSQADLQMLFPTDTWLSVSYDIPDKNRSFAIPRPSANAADKELVAGSVAVQVNGRSVGFKVNGNFVNLNRPPPVNAKLAISADYKALVYDLAQQTHRIDGGNTACAKGSAAIACVHNRNSLRFNQPDQFAVEDKITATQMVDVLADNGEKLLTLQARYIKESVQLEVGGKTCSHDQLLFDGKVINLTRSTACPHLKNLTDQRIVVNYSQYDNTSSFNLDVPDSMADDDNWKVKVMINGKELKPGEDYAIDRAKRVIHFLALESIDYDSEASVSYDIVE